PRGKANLSAGSTWYVGWIGSYKSFNVAGPLKGNKSWILAPAPELRSILVDTR
ncbi:hypothetical protein DOY81_011603, partial [Sarcophaga bullata]